MSERSAAASSGPRSVGNASDGSVDVTPGRGLAIGVLGDLIATGPDGPVDLGGRRQRAVLALLVIARGDVVPAESLVESVWGERRPADGLGALQSFISHLRRRLEPGRSARARGSVIVSRGPGYALSMPVEAVDAWLFERRVRSAESAASPRERGGLLSEALGLWRGPAYAEYSDEPWAAAEVTRLRELRELARERLVEARLALGEAAVLVPEAETLVNEEPLREERWRLLVLALYRAHRQGDALAALRRARRTLADELGIDPGPALRALESEVLAQSPSLDVEPAPPPTLQSGATPEAPAVRSAPDDLVDRDLELAELGSAASMAFAGKARLVVVRGPAGIGKTRLLAEVRRSAGERGARICAARGSVLERDFGFGAVRQLLEPVVEAPDALTGPARAAASVFDLGASDSAADGWLAVLHGLYCLVANLTRSGPLLLAIDDLQWCDVASLRFFAYLVRRMESLPLLVVATLRTGEASADEAVLAELEHDPATLAIQPAPLSSEGVAGLVRERFGPEVDDEFVAACQRATSGNPLLLRQLLRALQSEGVRPGNTDAATVTAVGSRAISSMVLMRLSRMSPASTQVARAVAVLGSGAALPMVARLANLAEEQAAAVVAGLARAEVLRDDYPLSFVHPVVADAVYRDLPPGQRQLVHDRAAHLLDERGAAPEQVAAHLLQAPPRGDPWAVRVLVAAATRAAERAAPEAAATYLRRAVQEPPPAQERPAILHDLGRAAQMANHQDAIPYLTEAYEGLEPGPQRAVIAQMLARTLIFLGTRGEGHRFARRAAAELPEELRDERQGLLAQERIAGYMHDLPVAEWRYEPEPELSGDGIGARFLATTLAWEAAIDGDDRERAVRLARFATADDKLVRVDVGHLWAVAGLCMELADEETGPFWQRGLSHSLRRGAAFGLVATNLWLGYYRWRRGELREALQSFRIATSLAEMNQRFGVGWTVSYTASALIEQGELAAARSTIDTLTDAVLFGDSAWLRANARAHILLAEGRPAEALASIDSVRDVQASIRNPAWRPWRSERACVLLALGEFAPALSLVEDELALARRWGAARPIGRTLRLRAEILAAAGAADEALGTAHEAVEVLRPTTATLEYARALRVLAACLDGAGAVSLLRDAADLAWRCDARPEYERVLASLAALDEPPPPRPPAVTRLTTLERDIVARYLGGASERDIAEALFLTPRTVRSIIQTVRQVLGVADRADLRSALQTG